MFPFLIALGLLILFIIGHVVMTFTIDTDKAFAWGLFFRTLIILDIGAIIGMALLKVFS